MTKGGIVKMRRATVLVAIAAALCVTGAATAAPPNGTLNLRVVGVGFEETPDGFTFTELVYQRGKLVGTDRHVCKYWVQFPNVRCRTTVSLPNGNLFLYIAFLPSDRGRLKVTGGSGAYQGRTGIGIYRSVSENATKVRIWLTSR
jgi:hypothetical protein